MMKSSHCVEGTRRPEVSGSRAEVCWRLELSALTGGSRLFSDSQCFYLYSWDSGPSVMGAVKTPGQECSALLQGLLACHIREVQRGNGTDTALALTDSQMGREGKHGGSHRSLRLMLKEPAECPAGLTWGEGGRSEKVSYCLFILKPRQEPVPAQCTVGEHCS